MGVFSGRSRVEVLVACECAQIDIDVLAVGKEDQDPALKQRYEGLSFELD